MYSGYSKKLLEDLQRIQHKEKQKRCIIYIIKHKNYEFI